MAVTREKAERMMIKAGVSKKERDRQLGPAPSPQPSKMHNIRTRSDIIGRNFHSDAERRYAEYLYAKEQAGEIRDLEYQKKVVLLGALSMIVDFRYYDNELGCLVHDEFKGFATDKWRLQRKIWEQCGPTVYRVTKEHPDPINRYHWTEIHPKPGPELVVLVLKSLLADAGEACG